MKDWFQILKTSDYAQANIIKGMLEENEVPVIILNKQDSSYLTFGYLELYVPVALQFTAQELLNKDSLQ